LYYLQVDFFLVVMACSVLVRHLLFRGSCCFHLQGADGSSM